MYLISGAFALIIGIVLIVGYLLYKKNIKSSSYDEQFAVLMGAEDSESERISIFSKWNSYWSNLMRNTGLLRYEDANNRGGTDVIILAVAMGIIISFLLKNPLAGVVLPLVALVAASFFLKNASSKKRERISKQLPGFIFALKANIDARKTPEQAFLNVVADVPSPLYEEISMVRDRLRANEPFTDALIAMKDTTSSNDLKFLAACIIQANASGGDIKEQLITIQDILERQQEVSDEITKGAKTATPVLWVATALIPGSIIGMLILDQTARDFWFKDPISWILFMIIVAFYGFAVYYVRKQVEGLRNF